MALTLGLSENDYMMISTRMSNSDPSVFTNSLYTNIDNMMSEKNISIPKLFILTFNNIVRYTLVNTLGKIVIIMLLISLFLINPNKKWMALLTFAMICSYFLLFGILGRTVERVTTNIYFFALITLLFCYNKSDYSIFYNKMTSRITKRTNTLVISIIISLFTISITPYGDLKAERDKSESEIFDYIEQNTQNFYALTLGVSNEYALIDNLLMYDEYWNTWNSFYLTQFPISSHENAKFQKYSVGNLYKDSINSDIIRIVDKEYIDIIIAHIQEHYDSKATIELVDSIGNYNIYKIVQKR